MVFETCQNTLCPCEEETGFSLLLECELMAAGHVDRPRSQLTNYCRVRRRFASAAH